MDRCDDCGREYCPLLHLGEPPDTKGMSPEDATQAFTARTDQIQRARFDCQAHAINWRERALAAESRERWIPVTERLPEQWQDVLVAWDGTLLTAYLHGAGVWRERYSEQQIPVTLWRPLPAPPEQ